MRREAREELRIERETLRNNVIQEVDAEIRAAMRLEVEADFKNKIKNGGERRSAAADLDFDLESKESCSTNSFIKRPQSSSVKKSQLKKPSTRTQGRKETPSSGKVKSNPSTQKSSREASMNSGTGVNQDQDQGKRGRGSSREKPWRVGTKLSQLEEEEAQRSMAFNVSGLRDQDQDRDQAQRSMASNGKGSTAAANGKQPRQPRRKKSTTEGGVTDVKSRTKTRLQDQDQDQVGGERLPMQDLVERIVSGEQDPPLEEEAEEDQGKEGIGSVMVLSDNGELVWQSVATNPEIGDNASSPGTLEEKTRNSSLQRRPPRMPKSMEPSRSPKTQREGLIAEAYASSPSVESGVSYSSSGFSESRSSLCSPLI